MLFNCLKIRPIWEEMCDILDFEITWEHIVIGRNGSEENVFINNFLLSVVAYAIFKENSHCKFSEKNYAQVDISSAILRNINFYKALLSNDLNKKISDLFGQ